MTIKQFMNKYDFRKIVVAVTGASGAIYAKLLIEKLKQLNAPPKEIAVIFSDIAKAIWVEETGSAFKADTPVKEYANDSFFAPFASGSSSYDAMIICPASMGTIGRIAGGISDSLITRTADVMLKERRKLIITPRETPYNLIHIENFKTLTLAGAVICPASPSFYNHSQSVNELAMTIVDRIIDLAGFENNAFRWMEND
jgi:4-hydroxy-3-polyprenylbenzoate decarboxylase